MTRESLLDLTAGYKCFERCAVPGADGDFRNHPRPLKMVERGKDEVVGDHPAAEHDDIEWSWATAHTVLIFRAITGICQAGHAFSLFYPAHCRDMEKHKGLASLSNRLGF